VDGAEFGDGSVFFESHLCTDGAVIFFGNIGGISAAFENIIGIHHDMVWAFYTPLHYTELFASRLLDRLESGEGTFCISGGLCILIDGHIDQGQRGRSLQRF
jgi:hypothetical protein